MTTRVLVIGRRAAILWIRHHGRRTPLTRPERSTQ